MMSLSKQRQSHAHTVSDPTSTTPFTLFASLDRGLVRDGGDGLGDVVLHADGPGVPGESRLPLELDALALGLGGLPPGGVLLDADKELLTRAGVADVLNADVDALLDVAVADLLVEDDTDRRLGDVVDDTGLAVVDLVGHTVRPVRFPSSLPSFKFPRA